ncbi:sigma-70 family RNA polymerase sigma factor [Brevundimonas sp.]|uniref:sigma-70 family RNA polymerase sigma factor n=1 Tax=Brevundimonas sp. TaxID=1871086 RepID=UPI0028AE7A08|nr:sigma-70 family RNA polymerase sigma factor [Brevundimonas sp.]
MGSTSTPRIPIAWMQYIASAARRYAIGVLDPEDLVQIGVMAFILASRRHQPSVGPFDRYVRVAIRNAMLKARLAEQRQYDLPGDESWVRDDASGPFAPEDTENDYIQRLEDQAVAERMEAWKGTLTRADAIVVEGLFFDERPQESVARELGVTQARVSQRKKRVLANGHAALSDMTL